jgi:hypothetical protein
LAAVQNIAQVVTAAWAALFFGVFKMKIVDEQLKNLLEPLKAFGITEESLLLAQAMKNMKDTGYGNLVELPITPNQSTGFDIKIDRSNFAWKWLYYSIVPENLTTLFNFTIDVQFGQDRRAFKGPIRPLATMYGSPRTNLWKINNPPIVIAGESTVNVEVTNVFAAPLANPLAIQIWLMGNEKVGM